jgi:ribosomal protein S18 acetylase RimI-like enzyme
VFLVAEADNAAALGLYRSLGFEKIGDFVSYRRTMSHASHRP